MMLLLQHLITYRSNSEFVFLTLEKEKRGTLKNYHFYVSGETELKNPYRSINSYQHFVFFSLRNTMQLKFSSSLTPSALS